MEKDKLKINIIIDGKKQQLEIKKDAEEVVREAAKRVNDMLFEYRKLLKLNDPSDYMGFVALQQAMIAVEHEFRDRDSSLNKDLADLENLISEHLAELKK